jgi:uncharacterized protein YjbJ (UPF0337 family)
MPSFAMKARAVAGWWKQCRGAVKVVLGRATHNRLLEFDGQQDTLNGRLQAHGMNRRGVMPSVGKTMLRRPPLR